MPGGEYLLIKGKLGCLLSDTQRQTSLQPAIVPRCSTLTHTGVMPRLSKAAVCIQTDRSMK